MCAVRSRSRANRSIPTEGREQLLPKDWAHTDTVRIQWFQDGEGGRSFPVAKALKLMAALFPALLDLPSFPAQPLGQTAKRDRVCHARSGKFGCSDLQGWSRRVR
jgi:hypothetical protein